MTNYEYYRESIEKLGYLFFAVSKYTGEAVDCNQLRCEACIFHDGDIPCCGEKIAVWLDLEYEIPLIGEVE